MVKVSKKPHHKKSVYRQWGTFGGEGGYLCVHLWRLSLMGSKTNTVEAAYYDRFGTRAFW